MRWCRRDGLEWLAAELPGGVQVAFTGRLGGSSRPPFDGLNLGFHTDDEAAAVAANRRQLCAALGLAPDRVLTAHQVHGAEVELHEAAPPDRDFLRPGGGSAQGLPEADGQLVTPAGAAAGLAPLVLVADCLPVAIAGPGGIGMLHCGWRPLAAGIIARGAAAIGAEAAAIGPGIGPCCFEVGEEVHAQFAALDLGPGIAQGRNLDLPEIAARLLRRAGVKEIERAEICTRCESERFYSHRRDGATAGRQAGVAWIGSPPT